MTRSKIWIVSMAVGMVILASAAWGTLDSPAGVGFDFPVKGTRLEGFTTLSFIGYNGLSVTASGFEGVAQLQLKKELHVLSTVYDCDTADPCEICNATGSRIDVTAGVDIALCLTDQLEEEVIADFGLPEDANVQLQSASEFVSEVDFNDPNHRVVAAQVVAVF